MRLPLAVTAALFLTFTAACDQAPTGVDVAVDPELAFYGVGDTGDPGETSAVTPSTNAQNVENGWAHVIWNSFTAGPGEAPLLLVQPRNFFACFEYRIDGEAPTLGPDNYNTNIEDGLWEFECLNNETMELTLYAEEYVEVRMVFGAEGDERFDWTRFDVQPQPPVLTKDDCKDGGWQPLGFKNQGQCVRYVETGKDSRDLVAFGHVAANGTWADPPRVIELDFEAYGTKNGPVGDVYYENHTDDWFFQGRVTCFAMDGNQAILGAVSTSEDDNGAADNMYFYLEDNPGDVDRYRPLIGATDCSTVANPGAWYDVFEGDLTIH